MSMKIDTLEIQNVKRIKAVRIDCTKDGLTVIGGKNGQGKTSVLSAIAFALGGQRYCPSNLKREGAIADPEIRLTMNNGLIVERKGKGAALKITDPEGGKSGQQLLNTFVSELAINLPKFMNATAPEKAKLLLSLLGIGEELEDLERREKKLYDDRHAVGQLADRKKKFAEEMPCYDGVPEVPVTASELIQQQQKILAKNGENQRKRHEREQLIELQEKYEENIRRLEIDLHNAKDDLAAVVDDLVTANKDAATLQDESTVEIEGRLEEIETTNAKVRANLDKGKAQDDAGTLSAEYDVLTEKIDAIRRTRLALLNGADLPLPGLMVENGALVFNGCQWDCMSGAEQLRVGTAIAQKFNPNCGFVLLDKVEQFDTETLQEFGAWLEGQNLQAIATRVSTGEECSIIIEDGKTEDPAAPAFSAGKF